MSGEYAAARQHCDEMSHWYEGTGIPSLIQHCQVVRSRVHALISERLTLRPRALPMLDAEANSTSLSVVRSFTGTEVLPLAALAQRALRVLIEQHRASLGHLYWVEEGACQHAASLATEALDGHVVSWLRQRIHDELEDTTTAAGSDALASIVEPDLLSVGSRYYRLLLLFHPAATGKDGLLGAAVVANDVEEPALGSSKVLDAVADQLQRGLQRRLEERSSTTA